MILLSTRSISHAPHIYVDEQHAIYLSYPQGLVRQPVQGTPIQKERYGPGKIQWKNYGD